MNIIKLSICEHFFVGFFFLLLCVELESHLWIEQMELATKSKKKSRMLNYVQERKEKKKKKARKKTNISTHDVDFPYPKFGQAELNDNIRQSFCWAFVRQPVEHFRRERWKAISTFWADFRWKTLIWTLFYIRYVWVCACVYVFVGILCFFFYFSNKCSVVVPL